MVEAIFDCSRIIATRKPNVVARKADSSKNTRFGERKNQRTLREKIENKFEFMMTNALREKFTTNLDKFFETKKYTWLKTNEDYAEILGAVQQ